MIWKPKISCSDSTILQYFFHYSKIWIYIQNNVEILSMMNVVKVRYDDSCVLWSILFYKIIPTLTISEVNCIWQHIPKHNIMNLQTLIRTYQKEKYTISLKCCLCKKIIQLESTVSSILLSTYQSIPILCQIL